MQIVTVASDLENANFINFLKRSTLDHGLQLVVLDYSVSTFDSNRIKDQQLFDYLCTLDESEIVLFTDAYDAILVASEDEILQKYEVFNGRILFSAEMRCWPDESLADQFPETNTPYRFLNSGGFIGNAGLIRDLLKNNSSFSGKTLKYPWSNQYCWSLAFLSRPDVITLDTTNQIFTTFSSPFDREFLLKVGGDNTDRAAFKGRVNKAAEDPSIRNEYIKEKLNWFNQNFSYSAGRLMNLMTGTKPCHLHFNGLSKGLMINEMWRQQSQ